MDTEKDYVGEVDGGLMSPDMVTENVWIAINDDVELISVRVILFYVKLTEQTGNYLIPEPEMFAHVDELISIVMVDGIDILIFPVDVIGSKVVIVKVYEVLILTTDDNKETSPLKVLYCAVIVTVPYILEYPLLNIYKVIGSVVFMEGGAV